MNGKAIGIGIAVVGVIGLIGYKVYSSIKINKIVKQLNDFIIFGNGEIPSFDDVSVSNIYHLITHVDNRHVSFKMINDGASVSRAIEVGTKLRSILSNRGKHVPDYVK